MAGTSDKARFYLEQSIPELQELERKNIFTKVSSMLTIAAQQELNNSARKRSLQSRRRGRSSNISSMLEGPIRQIICVMSSSNQTSKLSDGKE